MVFNMANNFFRFRRLGQLAVLTLTLVCYTGANSQVVGLGTDNSENLLGNYLAGRFANYKRDVNIAIEYYARALKQDPESPVLVEQLFLLEVKAGKWDDAKIRATQLIKQEPNHYIARLFLGSMAFKAKNYKLAQKHFSQAGKSPIAALTTELAIAWTLVAENKPKAAVKMLGHNRGADGVRSYRYFHRALIADLTKQDKVASDEYKRLSRGAQSLRVLHAHARYNANKGRFKEAMNLLMPRVLATTVHPITEKLYDQIRNKKKPGLIVKTASAGLAEVLYGLGDALRREGGMDIALIYLKIGLLLHPELDEANDSLAEVYERTGKHDEAITTYAKVTKESPLWPRAQIRKAVNYNSLGQVEKSKELLDKLSALQPTEIGPLDTLGNLMRSHKRYKEAVQYYDKAIALIKKPGKEHWSHFYSRGVSYERMGNWDMAEKDLKKANQLDPNQPLVLNYLGYSWVDQNKNLKLAMKHIRKAVRLRPNDGYFVDSLGWAHYRLGNYELAVRALERAVLLKPDDPVINDHLGDAYWKVGRKRESGFQWSQALSLKPEEKVKVELLRKLKEGLERGKTKDAAQLDLKDKKTVKK